MESRAKLLGHPIHQMLIVFPLGILTMGVAADVVSFFTSDSLWPRMAYYLIIVGVGTGLLAAVFGAVDYFAIPRGTRAKSVGTAHGLGNVVVVALFAASWLLRRPSPESPAAAAYIFSFLGVGISLLTAWLGGELVDRLGVGVDDGAHLNAPSSLSEQPASSSRTFVPHGGASDRRRAGSIAYAGLERRAQVR